MKNLILTLVLVFSVFSLNVSGEDYAGWTVGQNFDGYGAIFGTIDSGTTWVRQGSNQIADTDMSGVFAVDSLTAWVVGNTNGSYSTIYNTIDGGQTWTRKGFGQAALLDLPLAKVHVSSNNIWAVGQNAILHSSDNGDSWTNCIPIEDYKDHLLQGVFSINGNIVWVTGGATNKTGFAPILKTTNAGKSWIRQTGGGITNADHIIGISAANTNSLWAVGGGGSLVFSSDDGGDSWKEFPPLGGFGDANEVYAVDTQTVWIAVDGSIDWTYDGGLSWSNHNAATFTMGIAAVNKLEAWAATRDPIHDLGLVYHTSNGGENWDMQVFSNTPFWTISFALDPVPEPAILWIIGFLILLIFVRIKFILN